MQIWRFYRSGNKFGQSLQEFIYFLCRVKETITVRAAVPADCAIVMQLIRELAVYEKAADEVLVTESDLREHAFGSKRYVEILVAEVNGKILGAALFYEKYSTWKGPAIHLEDLIVAEDARGGGIGAALLNEVLRIGAERGYRRVYWQVLDWNTAAMRFYERYQASFDAEWVNVYVELNQHKQL